METWLFPNRRAVGLGMVPLLLLGLAGLSFGLGWFGLPQHALVRVLGFSIAGGSALLVVGLVFQLRVARVGYTEGTVYFFLRSGRPVEVPLEYVEAFLMGQGPSHIPGQSPSESEATTVIVRLAEVAKEWARIDVNPRLGSWCDGYITIRGAWCEPLNVEVVKRLNRRLAETKREQISSGGEQRADKKAEHSHASRH